MMFDQTVWNRKLKIQDGGPQTEIAYILPAGLDSSAIPTAIPIVLSTGRQEVYLRYTGNYPT